MHLAVMLAWAAMQAVPQPVAVAPSVITRSGAAPTATLDYFAGRWTGSGTFVRSGKPVGSTYQFDPVLGGEALFASHAELPPNSFAFVGLWSVDKRSGELVLMMAGNQAGGARLFRSKGWEGERLNFQPDPGLRTDFAMERMTFERQGKDRFTVRYEVSRDGTTWGGGDVQTFVKQEG